ncbi:helix-turn-helix transcriptional regulator [Micromonospora sp. WMMA1363]|uniref:helix-turn-helix domain-containing protein n=1 Tax=Micromonospora sp. WMMA1363 TaxID=3053985 RepID=UPI00259CB215|nr:helix-turn-helix transcriptional regulator [Micromonospora sp. WMMA1363]MDM4719249.1 helix-turn-helix transcriptional regulator [Micromonospora sp. WMMA1363]
MHDNLGEQLTIDDMARAAFFSKFHFSRIFQRATGISPGRFLSALRLQRAKQLLVSTSLNVADVSLRVGYASVGTFSSRFTRSVGLSPTTYRRLGGYTSHVPVADTHSVTSRPTGSLRGRVVPASNVLVDRVFVGVFPDRIPEGRPVQCCVLNEPGEFVLDRVPVGVWHVLAHSVGPDLLGQPSAEVGAVGSSGPILIRRDGVVELQLSLQPMRILDPPVLLVLEDVRRSAMQRTETRHGPAAADRDVREPVGAGLR